MNRLTHKLYCIGLLLILIPLFSNAQEFKASTADKWKSDLEAHAASINTITADFVQEKHLSVMSDVIESSGKFWFQSKDKLRWEYQKPYAYVVILDGEKVIINDNGNKDETDAGGNKIFKRINKLMLGLVNGQALNNPDFDYEYFESNEELKVVLKPKQKKMGEYISAIDIHFSKKDFSVNSIKMHETGGDYTRISFSNKKMNTEIPDGTFEDK